MSTQNTLAIYGMCAIVITLYAIRDSHTDYLADLFGLALALAAPQRSYALGAVGVAFIIRHTALAEWLAPYLPEWIVPIVLPAARDMSISEAEAERLERAYDERISEAETERGNAIIMQPVAENEDQIISSAQIEIMAKSVNAGVIGLTEATRILAGVQSGRKYSATSRRLKMRMHELENRYPDLTPQKQQRPKKPS